MKILLKSLIFLITSILLIQSVYASSIITTNLGKLPGDTYYSRAYGINDKGQIVGDSVKDKTISHAFLWQNGKMTDLGTLPGFTSSHTVGINNNGQIVGYCFKSGNSRPFLWQNGKMIDLGTLPGGQNSDAMGINNNGQIVGGSNLGGGSYSIATLWTVTDKLKK